MVNDQEQDQETPAPIDKVDAGTQLETEEQFQRRKIRESHWKVTLLKRANPTPPGIPPCLWTEYLYCFVTWPHIQGHLKPTNPTREHMQFWLKTIEAWEPGEIARVTKNPLM